MKGVVGEFKFSEFLSDSESDSYNHIITANKLLITFLINYSQLPDNVRDEFFQRLERIFKRNNFRKTFIALCRMRCASWSVLLSTTGISEPGLSNALKYLKQKQFVQEIRRFSPKRRGGPKPWIYGVLGYEPEDVTKAIQTHTRLNTPAYAEARRIKQIILEEYTQSLKDISLSREIIPIVKTHSSRYQPLDLSNAVADLLHMENGVKVWR